MSKVDGAKSCAPLRSERCNQDTENQDGSFGSKASDMVYILTLACDDRPGIVASVAGTIAEFNGNIIESSQFGDPETNRFFMRVKFGADKGAERADLLNRFSEVGEKYAMQWRLYDGDKKTRTIIMASKTDHCINDLIYRTRIGAMPVEIVRVVSNHESVGALAKANDLAFTYLPVNKENKAAQEQALRGLMAQDQCELIVLARYMQILSNDLSSDYFGTIINIHHSFLPGFKGAKPYHRAHARGVKLIGATAHYVTPDLDEGPIIEQETERVTHAMSAKDLVAAGRDIERRVLSRAVKYHCEHRVLINDGRTVVFT